MAWTQGRRGHSRDAGFGVTTPSKPAAMGSAGGTPLAPLIPHLWEAQREMSFGGSEPGQALGPHPHSFALILFVSNIWPGYGDS